MRARLVLALALAPALGAGCVSALLRGRSEHARLLASLPKEAAKIGNQECLDCHTTVADFVASSVHAKEPGCETCHGPGDLHVSDGPGNIVGEAALEKMSPHGRSEMCVTCHAERATQWPHADHAKAGVACESCHTDAVHWKQDDAAEPPRAFANDVEFCAQCHAGTVAELSLPYRHPVGEGTMDCGTCHDPHGETPLRAMAPDHGCATCHAEQAGPKVFRHAAQDDGCGTCHQPHGSPVQALLFTDGNGLCLQCHHEPAFPVIAGVDHSTFLAEKSRCWDCHVELHGSNSDPTFLGRLR